MWCNTGHGVVGALGSQAQHMRGTYSESWGTAGRSWVVMWCFRMRHFAPWWMTVVYMGLASFGATSRVSVGTGPVTGGTGSCFQPVGMKGGVPLDGTWVLLFDVPLRCLHVLVSRQSVLRCPRRLCEVLVEEAVLRPLRKLWEGAMVCSAAVKDPYL